MYLSGTNMTGGYGATKIIHEMTIEVDIGEVVVIVGPNGSGKSTSMKALLGMIDLSAGTVTFNGKDITGLSPQQRVADGLGFVPQNRNIFPGMTVKENLEVGGMIRPETDLDATIDDMLQLFPALKEKYHDQAGHLSGGQRQQVAVARAMMAQPRTLLLDEPTAGVSPQVMDELLDRIIAIARSGIAILMVEQNARQALEIADRAYVLVSGRNAYHDTGHALLNDPEVRRAFLGG